MQNSIVTFPIQGLNRDNAFLHFDDTFDRSIAGFMSSRAPVQQTISVALKLPLVAFSEGVRQLLPFEDREIVSFDVIDLKARLVVHKDRSANLLIKNPEDETLELMLPCPLKIKLQGHRGHNRALLRNELQAFLPAALKTPFVTWRESESLPVDLAAPWCDLSTQTSDDIQAARGFCTLVLAAGASIYPDWADNEKFVDIIGRRILPNGCLSKPRVSIVRSLPTDEFVEEPRSLLTDMANKALRSNHFAIKPHAQVAQEWNFMSVDDEGPRISERSLMMCNTETASDLSAHHKIDAFAQLMQMAGYNKTTEGQIT